MYTLKTFRANITEAFLRAEKGEEVLITRLGTPFLLVLSLKKKPLLTQGRKISELPKPKEYGCGCKVKDESKLCPKHGRN